MRRPNIKRLGAAVASAFLVSTLHVHLPTDTSSTHFSFTSEALARSSGGRSGGGSFRSSPSRSSSSSSSRSSSSSSSSSSRSSGSSSSSYQQRDRSYGGPSYVPVPVPVGPNVYSAPYGNGGTRTSQTQDDGGWIVGLVILGIFGLGILLFVLMVVIAIRQGANNELDNNKVTISKIQVALLAQAREIQDNLTALSMEVDTDTPEGLLQLLQESVLALLRTPENWSHVLASSQMVKNREEAETIFNQMSIAERSKFSVETLTNVGGRGIRRKDFQPDPEEDPAAYIVITLLVGTAHDQPLFSQIRTAEELQQVLEKLASISSDYLMVFELLWSPQEASDSLTYDELLTEYTDMVQI